MSAYRILSVEIVKGNTLNSNWRKDMQKIQTDHGEFIDNMEGVRSSPGTPIGFAWKDKIGCVVNARSVFSKDHQWLTPDEAVVESPQVIPPGNLSGQGHELLSTSKIAKLHNLRTKEFEQRLINAGYLEKSQDGQHLLTLKGKNAGGQPRNGQFGPFFVWPCDLAI